MNCSFFKSFIFYLLIVFIFCTLFIPVYSTYPELFTNNVDDFTIFDHLNEYVWPIPGYTSITSSYGKRTSPTLRCV